MTPLVPIFRDENRNASPPPPPAFLWRDPTRTKKREGTKIKKYSPLYMHARQEIHVRMSCDAVVRREQNPSMDDSLTFLLFPSHRNLHASRLNMVRSIKERKEKKVHINNTTIHYRERIHTPMPCNTMYMYLLHYVPVLCPERRTFGGMFRTSLETNNQASEEKKKKKNKAGDIHTCDIFQILRQWVGARSWLACVVAREPRKKEETFFFGLFISIPCWDFFLFSFFFPSLFLPFFFPFSFLTPELRGVHPPVSMNLGIKRYSPRR